MSRRTAESNKAILEAWDKEQELVKEGKGTREWTPEQQKDILEKGKAYDDDGVAFQGQHMKSAEQYPEYQGDSGNIQFLTRTEHLEAHNGNWRNPTNWYFNPVTKEKIDFGDGPFIPCKILQLPEPIVHLDITVENKDTEISEPINEVEVKRETQRPPDIKHKKLNKVGANPNSTQSFVGTMRKAFKAVVDFSNRHPVLTNIVKGVSVAGLAVVADAVSNSRHLGSGSRSDDYDYNASSDRNDTFENVFSGDASDIEQPIERASPDKHTVRRHGQHYHYKDGSVKWKEKDSYPRGGNKDE